MALNYLFQATCGNHYKSSVFLIKEYYIKNKVITLNRLKTILKYYLDTNNLIQI